MQRNNKFTKAIAVLWKQEEAKFNSTSHHGRLPIKAAIVGEARELNQ
jgi:hypothetical protein